MKAVFAIRLIQGKHEEVISVYETPQEANEAFIKYLEDLDKDSYCEEHKSVKATPVGEEFLKRTFLIHKFSYATGPVILGKHIHKMEDHYKIWIEAQGK